MLVVVAALAVPLLEAGDGVKVSPPIVLAHGDEPAGAVDRAGALAVWREHGCIELARIGGKPIELGCGATGAPRAASSGEITLVVWPSGGEIAGVLVTPELHVTAVHARAAVPIAVSAAYDGTQFLVASASCTEADLTTIDRAGKPGERHVLHHADGKDVDIAGAAVACEDGSCEVAYETSNATLGIDCEDEIRRPRWTQLATAPVTGGTVGKLAWADREKVRSLLTRHGVATEIGGFITRRDSAKDAFGTLIATTAYHSELWNGRETKTPDALEVELVPRDPHAAHHEPLAVPGETSPAVLALGGNRFVLLTASRDGVIARTITIDPAYFTRPRRPIPPVLRGHLRGANQTLPPRPYVGCFYHQSRCGFAVVHDDGSFVLPVADPLDHRVAAEVSDPAIVAYAGDEVWYSAAQHDRTAEIQLAAPAHLIGTVAWPGGKLPKVAPMPAQFVDQGEHGRVRLPDVDPLQLEIDAYAVIPASVPYAVSVLHSIYGYGLHTDGTFDVPVAATGEALLVAKTRNGEYGTTMLVTTESGKPTRAVLKMARTATLTVRPEGIAWSIEDDMRLANGVCATDGRSCAFEQIAAGPELLTLTTADWVMTRRLEVAAGETKVLNLPFVADLAPGEAGVKLARAIDGVTVTAVAPGGPAAGLLMPNDVIVAIDGALIGTDVAAALGKLRGVPGSRVEIAYVRARKPAKLTIERTRGTNPLGYTVVSP